MKSPLIPISFRENSNVEIYCLLHSLFWDPYLSHLDFCQLNSKMKKDKLTFVCHGKITG